MQALNPAQPSSVSVEVPVKVKICGVRTPAIVEVAAGEGADYIGFVFFAKSPRSVTLAEAKTLATVARDRIGTVAVLVDPDDALIEAVMDDVSPDMLQLHGGETPERVAAIGAKTSRPLMKAVRIAGEQDVASAAPYAECASYVLFDAKAPSGAAIPGGNGVAFDWRALKNVRMPFALSGGLTPDNVGEAIRLTGAEFVDVSSGVERAPGEKDAELVKRFIRAAKAASSELRVKAL